MRSDTGRYRPLQWRAAHTSKALRKALLAHRCDGGSWGRSWPAQAGARGPGSPHQLDLLDRNRPRIQVALQLGTPQLAKFVELLYRLDAFSHRHQSERRRETDDTGRQRYAGQVERQAADERTVNLQHVQRQSREQSEKRIAGTEVIEGDTYAGRT